MVTFFNRIRKSHPEYAAVATHIRNEGKRNMNQITMHKAEGLVTGCCDVIIPGAPAFCMELKSRSPKAKITDKQVAYLEAAQKIGAFACVALGADAATEAFNDWLIICKKHLTS